MMNLKGRLTKEQMSDLDGLILKLKSFNLVNLMESKAQNRTIDISEIRPIPSAENGRLWTYIRHICRMAVLNRPNFDSVQAICNRDGRYDVKDVVNEAVNDMCIHVYRYVWRDYVSSTSEGYVYGAAYQAFKTWRDNQNERMKNNESNRELFNSNKSVLTNNFSGCYKVSNSNVKPS